MLDLPRHILKPARYVGTEQNSVVKDVGKSDVRFALCYPDIYEIGMSYYGFFLLYEIANRMDGVWCERCFAPWPDMEEHLRGKGIPLFTLESRTPLHDMDAVGFSLSYELNVTNVLNMLALGGIPIRAAQRDGLPLVIGGGPLMLNPKPFEPFFDLIVVGEAEGVIVEILERLKGMKGALRGQILQELARLDGVYSPLLGKERVRRIYIEDLDASYHAVRPPIPLVGSVHDRFNVEISRGCGNSCRFCIAGYGYRPYRERSPERLIEIIGEGLAATGFEEISLLSLSSGDYSALTEMITHVREKFRDTSLSLPSLKIGSITEKEIGLLATGGKGGFTFALEASTPALRQRLNKDIEVDALLRQLPLLKKHGWRKLKLYFMIGFPWETEDDLRAIRDLITPFTRHGIEVNLSVSPFTPKPHTPFQWLPMEDEEVLVEKIALIKGLLRGKAVKVKARDIKTSLIEALISRGDERLTSLFEDLHRKGVRLEAWQEFFRPERYDEWFRDRGEEMGPFLAARGQGQPLPWQFIDTGIEASFLQEEFRKAEHGEKTVDCYSGCAACGLSCKSPGEQARSATGSETGNAHLTVGDAIPHATYTLRYGKYGDARYIGHLDTMSILLRAFRSAGVSVRMHGKYHPKPRISLSPALPVGVESVCELVEAEAYGDAPFDPVTVTAINRLLPHGLKVLEVVPGGLSQAARECSFVLMRAAGTDGPGTKWRNGRKTLSIWTGGHVKELWLSGRFERIIKVENRRTDGVRTDH